MVTQAMNDELINHIRKSNLVDDAALDAILARNESKDLLKQLIAAGLITPYQAKLLGEGKFRGFLINNKYKLLELIAHGGMGTVYLCEHVLMRRLVAMKVLPRSQSEDEMNLERFLREARAVASLDHPNIVRAFDLDRIANKNHCLILEYVDGPSLLSIVLKQGPLSVARAVNYIAQAAQGLQHAHENGWVHRDIKPNNILISRQGVIKILDMGLARLFRNKGDDLTDRLAEKPILGTLDYIAPEQTISSSDVDIRADIYSLGGTFYYLLTGHAPFGDNGTAAQKIIWQQTSQPASVASHRTDVPVALGVVIRRMMAKDPDDRYQTPAEVVRELSPWLVSDIPPPPETEMPKLCPALARYSQPESGSKGTRATTFVPTPATRSTPLTSDAGGYHDTNEAEDNVARTIIMSAPTWRGRPLDEPEPKVSLRGDAPQPGFLMQWGWALLGAAMLATIVGIIMVSAYQTNSPRNPPVPKAVPK